MSADERRRERRFRIQRDVVQDLVTVGLTEDVSIHGLRMLGLASHAVGQPVRFLLEVEPGRMLPVEGVVAWRSASEDGVRLAIRIQNPSPSWTAFNRDLEGMEQRSDDDEEPPTLRSAPRFSAVIPARYGLTSAEEEDCLLLDVGPGGVQLQGPLAPPAGTPVFVRIDSPEFGKLQLLGRVVWRTSEGDYPRMGLRLDSADESYYRMLARVSTQGRRQELVEQQPAPPDDDLLDGVEVELADARLASRD